MDSFRDTVVIVTGGARGPGREFARELGRRGFVVVLAYLDDQAQADAAIDEILDANGTALSVRADLTDELDVERLFAETTAAFGGVDVVVHAERLSGRLVIECAANRLRRGGAIIGVTTGPDTISPAIADRLRARGITITGGSPVLEPAGDHVALVALVKTLDRWRAGPGD